MANSSRLLNVQKESSTVTFTPAITILNVFIVKENTWNSLAIKARDGGKYGGIRGQRTKNNPEKEGRKRGRNREKHWPTNTRAPALSLVVPPPLNRRGSWGRKPGTEENR